MDLYHILILTLSLYTLSSSKHKYQFEAYFEIAPRSWCKQLYGVRRKVFETQLCISPTDILMMRNLYRNPNICDDLSALQAT